MHIFMIFYTVTSVQLYTNLLFCNYFRFIHLEPKSLSREAHPRLDPQLGRIMVHLQPVHWPDPARHIPLAAVPGVHDDGLDLTLHDYVFHVAHDTTVFRLHV